MLCAWIHQGLHRVSAGLWIRGRAETDQLCPLPTPSRLDVNGPGLGQSPWALAKQSQRPSAGAELAEPAQHPPPGQGPGQPRGQPQRAAGGGAPVTCPTGECRGAGLGPLGPLCLLYPWVDPRCLVTQTSPRHSGRRRARARPIHSFAEPLPCAGLQGPLRELERRPLFPVGNRVTAHPSAWRTDLANREQRRAQA